MTHRISFDNMCRDVLECEHYYEWSEPSAINEYSNYKVDDNIWVSCHLGEPDCNIEQIPAACPHIKALATYKIDRERMHAIFLDSEEKKEIWKKLIT